jgi:hypothetical protein
MNTVTWKNASPAARNAWRQFITLFGAAYVITPIYYQGIIAGSEYLTYSAKKLYFALVLNASAPIVSNGNIGGLALYNEANAVSSYIQNCNTSEPAIPDYCINNVNIENVYFGRIVASIVTYMIFNGYKVTWP